jgi:hypothetical protein
VLSGLQNSATAPNDRNRDGGVTAPCSAVDDDNTRPTSGVGACRPCEVVPDGRTTAPAPIIRSAPGRSNQPRCLSASRN